MTAVTNAYASPITVGGVVIRPGRTEDVPAWDDVKKNRTVSRWLDKGVIKAAGDAQSSSGSATYKAEHRGRGSYSVMGGDGKEVVPDLSKEDAEAFNAGSDEDRAAFVAERAKG